MGDAEEEGGRVVVLVLVLEEVWLRSAGGG